MMMAVCAPASALVQHSARGGAQRVRVERAVVRREDDDGDADDEDRNDGLDQITWSKEELKEAFFLQFVSFTNDAESWLNNVVYSDGKMEGMFASCTKEKAAALDAESCYMFNANVETIYGEFFTEAELDNYKFKEPVLTSIANGGPAPTIDEFVLDVEEMEGIFSGTFDCKMEHRDKVFAFEVSFQILDDYSITFYVLKTCGGGANADIKLGYLNKHRDLVAFDANKPLSVPGTISTTTVFMYLDSETAEVAYKRPTVQVDDPSVVRIKLRQGSTGGVLTSVPTFIDVWYDCLARKKTMISLTVSMPPYEDVIMKWEKDCNIADQITMSIGTTSDSANVYDSGKTGAAFGVVYSNLDEIDNAHYTVPVGKTSIMFFLANNFPSEGDGVDISIGRIVVTKSNPLVLGAVVAPNPKSPIRPSGGVLASGDSAIITVNFICKRAGRSNVLVTLPIVDGKNIEFGFTKLCENSQKVKEEGFLVTVSSSFYLMIFAGVVALGVVMFGGKKAYDAFKAKAMGYAQT
ncbi:hypothetical protein FVE85_8915 [Porphyridium purpureum]|uniref:Uncharacterized protein n=1 Tax=Porphyridium purpureum TaxID=35688 RepID=A0A5J4YG47_PORPP|nr:hypothetical protein FVE85_8915 [Porphyridium purpureum]|eukprot:POR5103..scf276_29